jgi:1,4-alpha-glucan branching enzyme
MTKKSSPKIKRRRITFQYENPKATQVLLVGNFNGWDEKKHPMKNDGSGRWGKNVLLVPGIYEYKFIVDGQWKKDPANKVSCPNSFGTSNSVLKVDSK